MATLTVSSITKQVDELAFQACRKMNGHQRKEFFESLRNPSYNWKYTITDKYYKGPRKGKRRELYVVDGRLFNQIWILLQNYAYVSTFRSHYYHVTNDFEDTLYGIKETLFNAMVRYGPAPSGQPLSRFFKRIMLGSLYNDSRRRGNSNDRKKSVVQAISLNKEIHSEDDSTTELQDLIPSEDEDTDFWTIIPSYLKEAVKLIVAGDSIKDVAEKTKIPYLKLQSELTVIGCRLSGRRVLINRRFTMTEEKTILAKDCEEGEEYVVAGTKHRVKVVEKIGKLGSGIIVSVKIRDIDNEIVKTEAIVPPDTQLIKVGKDEKPNVNGVEIIPREEDHPPTKIRATGNVKADVRRYYQEGKPRKEIMRLLPNVKPSTISMYLTMFRKEK